MDWTIELSGPGIERPTKFSYGELARMEMVRLDNVVQQMTHYPDKVTSWWGPPLDALLTSTGIKAGSMMITLEGSDGYRVHCTRNDLASAIIALQDGEGRWLAEVKPGKPIQLVPPHKTGDYWVGNLRRVVVEPLGQAGVLDE